MRKSIVILLTFFVISIGYLTWAESKEQKQIMKGVPLDYGLEKPKKLTKCEEFRRDISYGGMPGRFQAIHLTGSGFVSILDTKEGHLWAWGGVKEGIFLRYQGQICPGKKMGDLIDRFVTEQ